MSSEYTQDHLVVVFANHTLRSSENTLIGHDDHNYPK